MPGTKNQHYVSQIYLKRFTDDGRSLWFYDKSLGESKRVNIRNIASKRYFYELTNEMANQAKLSTSFVEDLFAEFEGIWVKTMDATIRCVETQGLIDAHLRYDMAVCIAIQFLRTRQFRESIAEFASLVHTDLLDFALQPGIKEDIPELADLDVQPGEYQVKYTDEAAMVDQFHFMAEPGYIDEIIRILQRHIWLVGINDTGVPFYTSDNPVVRQAHNDDPHYGGWGLGSEGIAIGYPISPRHILVLFERSHFRDLLPLDGTAYYIIDGSHVLDANRLQVMDSYRQVYCSINNFDLAHAMCNEQPELRDPDYPRWAGTSTYYHADGKIEAKHMYANSLSSIRSIPA